MISGQQGIRNSVLKKIMDILFISLQFAIMISLATLGDLAFMRSVAATTVLWIGYFWVENKFNFYMHNYVRAAVMLAILADGFFGYCLGYYETSAVFDKVLHIYGTYAFALFANVLITQKLKAPLPRSIECLLTVSLGISIGAIYEIAEFMVDSWGNPSLPSQPSLFDTNLDLVGDAVGALLAALHINYRIFLEGR